LSDPIPTHPIAYPNNSNPNWDTVDALLRLFFPQYYDPASPSYVPPEILSQLNSLAMQSRPWCLSNAEQNLAEAWFTAYLVSLRQDTSSGTQPTNVAGPIVSEREGDIAVTYADLSKSGGTKTSASTRPPSDPYDAWAKLWARCGVGSITTRYGDPVKKRMSASAFTASVVPMAVGVLQKWP
jgi:hypothetical protein